MSYSGLGQTQTTTTQTVTYRAPAYRVAPVIYAPGVAFARRADTGGPSQLYPMSLNPVEVEKAIYKDIPTSKKEAEVPAGTSPQKVIRMKSGLEVPAYILQRDIARKQEAVNQEAAKANIPPPKYHKIGVFATQKPAQAVVAALVLGYISGQLFYGFRH